MSSRMAALAVASSLLGLPVLAHEGHDHGAEAAKPVTAQPSGEGAQRLADGSVFVPKPAQRQLEIRTALARGGDHARAIELAGRVIADPNAGGRIQASLSGRVEPGPKGLPVLGQRVAKGELVAFVRHIEDPVERARQQADVADLETQVRLAKRRLDRYEQLEGSVPQREIESARLELESLEKRRATLGASLAIREALTAPVSGIISEASAVAGQVVEERQVLFEVIDPQRVMVEAVTYDLAAAGGLGQATAVVPGGKSFALRFVGGGRLMREQAIPLLFRPDGEVPAIAVGQPLKVLAASSERRRGVALPVAAIVKGAGGDAFVWLHAAAERFSPRRVKTEPLDAGRVLVTEGLSDSEKVVVSGAAALAQVR